MNYDLLIEKIEVRLNNFKKESGIFSDIYEYNPLVFNKGIDELFDLFKDSIKSKNFKITKFRKDMYFLRNLKWLNLRFLQCTKSDYNSYIEGLKICFKIIEDAYIKHIAFTLRIAGKHVISKEEIDYVVPENIKTKINEALEDKKENQINKNKKINIEIQIKNNFKKTFDEINELLIQARSTNDENIAKGLDMALSVISKNHFTVNSSDNFKKDISSNEIDHPAYYNNYNVEVIEMMTRIYGVESTSIFCELNAFKYRMRMGAKPENPIEIDLQKEQWYLNKKLELTQK